MPWKNLSSIMIIHARSFKTDDKIFSILFLVLNQIINRKLFPNLGNDRIKRRHILPINPIIENIEQNSGLLCKLLPPSLQANQQLLNPLVPFTIDHPAFNILDDEIPINNLCHLLPVPFLVIDFGNFFT